MFCKITTSAIGLAMLGIAQTPASKFEVASIKPADPNQNRISIQMTPGGRYVANAVTVSFLIQQAYGVRDFQIAGAPDWIRTLRWELNAKPEAGAAVDQESIKGMMQALLADRFQLAFTRETKEMPVYHLTIAKGGVKLKVSEVVQDSGGGRAQTMRMGRGQMSMQGASMETLATQLAGQMGRTVIDRTGLSGHYDITLKFSPESTQQSTLGLAGTPGAAPPSADSDSPTIFTALQELGLKLESAKGPVEVLAVARVEKPSEN
jgi:bla regulator protein blaR1